MGFPTSPSDEDIYTNANGTRYQYDATDNKWVVIGGAYSVDTLTVNTLQAGDITTDTLENIYFVATDAELDAAITAIGSGNGKIIVTADLTNVQATINNASASIVIEGVGSGISLDANGNNAILTVTSAKSFTIRDIQFDMNDFTSTTTAALVITSVTDKALVSNCWFVGDGTNGRGISTNSDYTDIINCWFKDIYSGVYSDTGAVPINITDCWFFGTNYYGIHLYNPGYSTVKGCYMYDCAGGIWTEAGSDVMITGCEITGTGSQSVGINLDGTSCSVIGCKIANYLTAIDIASDNNTIVGNDIVNGRTGILLGSGAEYNIITGNLIDGIDANNASDYGGIVIYGDYNVITGNHIDNFTNSSSGTCYGIVIYAAAANNQIQGNVCINNDTNYSDAGSSTRDDTSNMTTGANLNYMP